MSEPSSKAPAFKTPSVMRYERIQRILEGEPMLKSVLGPRDQPIVKRENEKRFFSKGAVEVTNALQQRGLDPHNAHRDIVLRVAADVLNIYGEKRSAKPEPKPPLPKPELPQTEEKAQTNEKPKAIIEEKKQQPPKPKIERQIKPVAAKPKAVRPVAPPKPKVAKAKKPPVKKEPKPEPAAAPVSAAPVATNGASPESVPSYYVYASAFSLAISLRNMLQVGDRSPGAEGRMAKVDAICQELNDLKHVVVPLPMDMMPPDMLKNANKAASADNPKRG